MNTSEILTGLQNYHNRQLSDQAAKDYLWIFERYDVSYVADGVKEWKFKNSPTAPFPSCAQLSVLIADAAGREKQLEKQREPEKDRALQRLRLRDDYQKAALVCMKKVDAEGLDPADFEEMEKRFPGVGWGEAAISAREWKEAMKTVEQSEERLSAVNRLRR